VLFEDVDENKIIASKLAVSLGAGICADCVSFRVENAKLIMTRPALGGNVTADIVCQSEITFATVRTAKNDGAKIIFSVGRGAIEQIDKIKMLAKKFGGEICCSRVVADSGKLPYEMQVGLTGKTVSPKVYVALGISGAVQHTSAISGSGTVIAVNIDKGARIFDYADYGIVLPVEKLLD
jgi:electron transfer flavoprotein alpha subunit